ncbi:unnamed protein product [Clavelina lepadiformis]|uniref:IRF tryptophan pentad repeat domain-containing protein n=1 Tax=Clavelina lepadiformis TaxID=159417 RepID=A0ABP0G2A9_CLALP
MDEQGKKLKQWLVDHTNQNRFRLSWDNEDKTRIKIPWPKVGDPNFEQNLEVCVAWAKHGETYTEPMSTEKYSQMKKRFADVLRKSRYLEKLEKIKRQSGDFVVYELLSRPKSNDPGKMKNQKRSHPHSSDHPSSNNSFKAPLSKVQNSTFPEHEACGDTKKQMERANQDCVQPPFATHKINQKTFAQQLPTGEPPEIGQNLDVQSRKQKRPHPHIDDHPSLNNSIEAPQCKIDNFEPLRNRRSEFFATSRPINPPTLIENLDLADDFSGSQSYHPAPIEANFPQCHILEQQQQDLLSSTRNGTGLDVPMMSPQEENLVNWKLDFLEKHPEKLSRYKISVHYRQISRETLEPVIEQSFDNWKELDFSHPGLRLVYEDANISSCYPSLNTTKEQKYVLPAAKTVDHEVSLCQTMVGDVLKNFDGGISLIVDDKLNLYVTRHPQISTVFYFKNPVNSCSSSTKVNQGETVILFSLANYIIELIQCRSKQSTSKPVKSIPIFIGNKPKTLDSNAFVRITVEHVFASMLEERFGRNDSLPELALSNPLSIGSHNSSSLSSSLLEDVEEILSNMLVKQNL